LRISPGRWSSGEPCLLSEHVEGLTCFEALTLSDAIVF
jgi:hypothetical protein